MINYCRAETHRKHGATHFFYLDFLFLLLLSCQFNFYGWYQYATIYYFRFACAFSILQQRQQGTQQKIIICKMLSIFLPFFSFPFSADANPYVCHCTHAPHMTVCAIICICHKLKMFKTEYFIRGNDTRVPFLLSVWYMCLRKLIQCASLHTKFYLLT